MQFKSLNSKKTICDVQVLESFQKAEKRLKPNPEYMFTDVYKEMPEHLEKQLQEMKQHVRNYKEHYPLENFEKME